MLIKKKWTPPPMSWLKCNIGSLWNKNNHEAGATWVLRNDEGTILLHGRRSFISIKSDLDANFESWLWAIDSMKTLGMNQVISGAEANDLIGAVNRPPVIGLPLSISPWQY